jgi:hypothetical protein
MNEKIRKVLIILVLAPKSIWQINVCLVLSILSCLGFSQKLNQMLLKIFFLFHSQPEPRTFEYASENEPTWGLLSEANIMRYRINTYLPTLHNFTWILLFSRLGMLKFLNIFNDYFVKSMYSEVPNKSVTFRILFLVYFPTHMALLGPTRMSTMKPKLFWIQIWW